MSKSTPLFLTLLTQLRDSAAVFLWGDEKSRRETRERVKRLLWPLLLAISLIPEIVQLF
jgi:hypothetical protein